MRITEKQLAETFTIFCRVFGKHEAKNILKDDGWFIEHVNGGVRIASHKGTSNPTGMYVFTTSELYHALNFAMALAGPSKSLPSMFQPR